MDENPKPEKKKSIFAKWNENLQNLKQMFQKSSQNETLSQKNLPIIDSKSAEGKIENPLNQAMMVELNKLKTMMPQSSSTPTKSNPKVVVADPYLPTSNFIPINAPNLNEIKLNKEEQKSHVVVTTETKAQPTQPKSVIDVRKEFLNELKRLKTEMKQQVEVEVDDTEDKEQMNQLKNSFMAELKRLKKNVDEEIKSDPNINPEEINDDEDWSDWD